MIGIIGGIASITLPAIVFLFTYFDILILFSLILDIFMISVFGGKDILSAFIFAIFDWKTDFPILAYIPVLGSTLNSLLGIDILLGVSILDMILLAYNVYKYKVLVLDIIFPVTSWYWGYCGMFPRRNQNAQIH